MPERTSSTCSQWWVPRATQSAGVPFTRYASTPLKGVRVYVLGPPQDAAYIRKLLSKAETYDQGTPDVGLFEGFLAALGDDLDAQERAAPFDEAVRIGQDKAKAMPFFQDYYGFDGGGVPQRLREDGERSGNAAA